jgi:hypothetical protein
MSGHLGLASPWARQAVPEPLRATLRASVPQGWTIGVGVPRPGTYRAWANHDASGRYALHIVETRSAEASIRSILAWIGRETETWTTGPDGYVVAPLDWKGTLDAAGE